MPTTKYWETIPAADYADRESWQELGDNRFSALRLRILVVQTSGDASRLGPKFEEQAIPPSAGYKLRLGRKRVHSRTDAFSEAIRTASTTRITEKLSAKISSELSTKVPGVATKLGSELLAETGSEISEEIEQTLTATSSHTVEDSEEVEHEITLQASPDARTAQMRLRYWPHRWDVYLHSYDYLELSYHRKWRVWKQIRETIRGSTSDVLGLPLTSLQFYQPQANVDFSIGPVSDQLDEPDAVEIVAPTTPMPRSSPQALADLEELAKLAFPVTKPEKSKAAKRKEAPKRAIAIGLASAPRRFKPGRKKLASKKSVAKRAAKKFGAKKASAKKFGAKKASVKKFGAKKAAPKRAMRKKARR
jgi:hypothetical protein